MFEVLSSLSSRLKVLFFLLIILPFLAGGKVNAEDLQPGIPDKDIFGIIYSGEELLQYEVSWTGGVRIGDLVLKVDHDSEGQDVIHARVTDYGVLKFFYPVDDTFRTLVSGPIKLPYRYEVTQKEGWGSNNRRLTLYDQDNFVVRYRRNDEEVKEYNVEGPVHNEFSSFYATRAMDLFPGNTFLVPTFADKKRNDVKVLVRDREELDTLLGRVTTIQVMPIMKFKGLYDKAGDTVIWMTDDACRVPVKINSKILIGSLTATLVRYDNPACHLY